MTKRKINNQEEVKNIDIPQDITKAGFWKRVPYKLADEQWNFIKAMWNNKNIAVFVDACAGSSKTTLAVGMAMLLTYEYKLYDNIYYIVNPCEEDKLGFIPGSISEKTSMYMEPLRDALMTWGYDPDRLICNDDDMDNIKNGDAIIKALPSTFLRGRNLSHSFVIIDEMQNAKIHDIKKILSRCHDDCKILCIGHSGQIDLKYTQDSGFEKYLQSARKQDFIEIVELTNDYRGKFSKWSDSIN